MFVMIPPGRTSGFCKMLVACMHGQLQALTVCTYCSSWIRQFPSMIDLLIINPDYPNFIHAQLGLPVVVNKFGEPLIRIIQWDNHGSIAGCMQYMGWHGHMHSSSPTRMLMNMLGTNICIYSAYR